MCFRLRPEAAPELALTAERDRIVLCRVDWHDARQRWLLTPSGLLRPCVTSLAVALRGIDVVLAAVRPTDRWALRHGLLRHLGTGLVLRPEHLAPIPGSQVLVGPSTGTDSQRWFAHPAASPRIKEIL